MWVHGTLRELNRPFWSRRFGEKLGGFSLFACRVPADKKYDRPGRLSSV